MQHNTFDPQRTTTLVLRTCKQDLSAYGGFVYPTEGYVEAPDWVDNQKCGNGLHGLNKGVGDGDHLTLSGKWLILEVYEDLIVDLDGKVKFPFGWVRHVGDQQSATSLLYQKYGNIGIVGCTATAGYRGTATAGDAGIATAGDAGTATAGYRGTATAGNNGIATAGKRSVATVGYNGTATVDNYGKASADDYGIAIAGDVGIAIAGDEGTAIAGDYGIATAGNRGTATAGERGTATTGNRGTAKVGNRGTATAGNNGIAIAGHGGIAIAGDNGTAITGSEGIASAGDGGVIVIEYYTTSTDQFAKRYAAVGTNNGNLKPNTKYKLDENGNFIEDSIEA